MTHQSPALEADQRPDAAAQLAQLREVQALVEHIAGRGAAHSGREGALDEAARAGSAYGDALPVTRRRVDGLVAETVAWAAAGVEALTRAGGTPAAAARLADELEDAIADLLKMLKL
ncbi:MAG TPA: hypothetical protein VEZ20_13535 [Allosphingosinicella sp.]|jgi:hypothetical protein|nr:hypothetical protein [Allosphingosinicella sp.]